MSFSEFAGKILDVMVTCHSEEVEGAGLKGGREANRRRSTGKQPASYSIGAQADADDKGCQPIAQTYTLQHIIRHFLIEADELGVFQYTGMSYKDIEHYVPDVTKSRL